MKKILLFAFIILFGGFLKAQSADKWQSIGMNIHDGTNHFSGVEGYCQLTSCNGVEIVLIKLINLNTYSVRASWRDLVLTNDDQRIPSEVNVVQDSVTIAPGGQVVGDCLIQSPLIIKLVDYGTDAANFKNIIVSDFDFVIKNSKN